MDKLDITQKSGTNLADAGKLKPKPAMGKAQNQAHSEAFWMGTTKYLYRWGKPGAQNRKTETFVQ